MRWGLGRPVWDVCSGALVISEGCYDIPQCTEGLVDLLALLQPLACITGALTVPACGV